MTEWRSVLDLDYIADLGAAIDALGESDAEAAILDTQTRVFTDVAHARRAGASLGSLALKDETRIGIDIERALREPWRRGGGGQRRVPAKSRASSQRWRGKRHGQRRRRLIAWLAAMNTQTRERKTER